MRVTADTNIYVSAFQFGGKPLELLQLARTGTIELAISEPILREVTGVLRTKFHRRDADLLAIEQEIRSFAELVTPTKPVDVIKHDPPDNRVLECAEESRSDVIVSGDSDLLSLRRFGNARIVRVAQFLRELPKGRAR